jgi:hypothetical protein
MHIDDYVFGRIRIGGRDYDADVIVYPDHVRAAWWRKEGHCLYPEDLAEVLADPPAALVVGTGHDGRMQVPAETLEALRARGIAVHVSRTREAVVEFNRLQREAARVVAALHLTC